ncbi:hypothetical protein ABT215_11280 [Streptomyces sp900105755]|uniref:hypothetical protein n=1 Tax=Streptomyces sp. 900105755 TaxID=3154389 RepID=UPI0033186058
MSTPVVRYRRKVYDVDTIQWTGHNIDDLIDFTGGDFLIVAPGEGYAPDVTAKVYDKLHDTWVGVKTGQHVVHGVHGEFYPIDEAVLAKTYELAGVLNFFQPGHTYSEPDGTTDWRFRCDAITTHPETGERTALGWRHFRGEWTEYAYGNYDWDIHLLAGITDEGAAR